jgi:nitrogen fixation protein NifQ
MNAQALQHSLDNNSPEHDAVVHSWLMSHANDHHNDHVLACILSSWLTGTGVLPDWLGLGQDEFIAMLAFHFPGLDYHALLNPGRDPDVGRLDERDELLQLLLTQRAGKSASEAWMAEIVVNACQGQDHLWQDLGLWSRKDLSVLMQANFPMLAARNDKDMKWKKFLYKQLCITEGIYTCRAPSCEVCADYQRCFGPED